MTTQVTVKAHGHAVEVRQIAPSAFENDPVAAFDGAMAVPMSGDMEQTFYVHDGMDLYILEVSKDAK